MSSLRGCLLNPHKVIPSFVAVIQGTGSRVSRRGLRFAPSTMAPLLCVWVVASWRGGVLVSALLLTLVANQTQNDHQSATSLIMCPLTQGHPPLTVTPTRPLISVIPKRNQKLPTRTTNSETTPDSPILDQTVPGPPLPSTVPNRQTEPTALN